MRILQITFAPITSFGGMEKVVWQISKEMTKKGHEVTILQTDLYGPKKDTKEQIKEKVRIISCKNNFFLGGYGYSSEFKRKLKEIWGNFDVGHIHGYGKFTSDFALKFLKGKLPIIFSPYGFFHDKKNQIIKKIHMLLLARRLKNADFCLGLTKLEHEKLLSLGIPHNKIKIISPGIKIKNPKMSKNPRDYFNKTRKDKPLMLYVGRIHRTKGLKEILEAIKDIDINFLIIGKDVGFKKVLNCTIKKNGLQEKVKFAGGVTDAELWQAYRKCDFLVLYSYWESFGIVVIEAMAAGKPVIASNRGALPYLVKNNKTGLIVEYPNVKKLKLSLESLIRNKKKRIEMGKEAKRFSKRFNWSKIIKDYEEIYKETSENA